MTADILDLLTIAPSFTYDRGKAIYAHGDNRLHLVVSGVVNVSRSLENGGQFLVDLFAADEIFGELSFVTGNATRPETAAAHTDAVVMSWDLPYVEDLIVRRPRLGLALVRIMAQREAEVLSRLDDFAEQSIEGRLLHALERFARKFGVASGSQVDMPGMTHELLSRYIGTTREIVTHYMNQFRRRGLLNYSRRGIHIFGDLRRAA